MKVLSVNRSNPTQITWNGKTETTGIYKTPVNGPIHLGTLLVADDTIANRTVHGGPDKACYLFSSDHYPFWQEQYPHLQWHWGMFGENLTLEGMDEARMRIGDIYRIGGALVQVSQPREPCYKLGIRFGSQSILEAFISHANPGAYVRVLQEGFVSAGDAVVMEEQSENPLTVRQCFELILARVKHEEHLRWALQNPALPEYKRAKLSKYQ
jgi:MOSC domain-containing protein YiiM